jgi:FSR family fosmidomycin resistance protein-like MFS transporter
MAHQHHSPPVNTEGKTGFRKGGAFLIAGLTSGHGVFHWFTRSFEVMMPEVREFFGLTGVGVGGISTTRELASGLVSLPGGIVTDMLRKYWGWVLAGCMALFGVGWLVIGLAPIYPILLLGMALVAIAASIWHLPAMSALSHHFSHHRGSALSFHGVGGQIGDAIAPIITGTVITGVTVGGTLVILAWNELISIYAVVPLLLTFLVFWAFKDLGKTAGDTVQESTPKQQLAASRALLKNGRLMAITLVAGLRGMAFVAYIPFLALYLHDVLKMSAVERGGSLTILVIVGIFSTPIMGFLSDKFGRKLVLIPGMLFLGIMTVLLVPYGQGWALIAILALLGTFLFSDQPILTAAALDVVGEGVAATTLGVISFSRFILSASSPIIAGFLYNADPSYPFYYIAALFGVAAIIMFMIPLPKLQPASHGHDDHGHDDHGHDDHGHDDHGHDDHGHDDHGHDDHGHDDHPHPH